VSSSKVKMAADGSARFS